MVDGAVLAASATIGRLKKNGQDFISRDAAGSKQKIAFPSLLKVSARARVMDLLVDLNSTLGSASVVLNVLYK